MHRSHGTFELDVCLRRIGERQLGLITVDQAAGVGVDRSALARRRTVGALVPVFPRVLRLAVAPATETQRALAAALAVPGSVVAGPSAAIIHGLPLPSSVRSQLANSVVSIGADRVVALQGITAVRHAVVPPSGRWMTTRVATPAATILLLPRFVDGAVVERCLDDALARRLLTASSLVALVESLPTRVVHGRRLLLDLARTRSGGIGHRSLIEQNVGRWLDAAGLVGWKRNYRVSLGDGRWIEVDFAWVEARVALEVSPFFTHGSRATQERDAERRRLLVGRRWWTIEATDADLANRHAFTRVVNALGPLVGVHS